MANLSIIYNVTFLKQNLFVLGVSLDVLKTLLCNVFTTKFSGKLLNCSEKPSPEFLSPFLFSFVQQY